MVTVIGPRDPKVEGAILTVSRSTTWSKGLSPFFLGPIPCYAGLVAANLENAWQYGKVYLQHVGLDGSPTDQYFTWRDYGWAKKTADRYPAGRGAKPEYTWWDGEKLTYVQARRKVYIPLYARAVAKTPAFEMLRTIYDAKGTVTLWDFDGYDHRRLGRTYNEVVNDPNRKCGHAFVLAMMLEGVLDQVVPGVFECPPDSVSAEKPIS